MHASDLKSRISESAWGSGVTWLFRIVTGAVFTFSGFVKGIDPWGTFYKFEDYLSAMSLDVVDSVVVAGVFALCALEFLVGVAFLTGSYRRLSSWAALAFMAVMLPLTFWLAVWEPVSDCGCFGDAVILSNWATFWKNVVLTLMAVWLVIFNRSIHWLITPALQWISLVAGVVYFIYIAYTGYSFQPMLDFRQYKTGTPLIEEDAEAEDEPVYKFVYQKEGKRIEVGEDDPLPDESEGWEFVDRIEVQSARNVTTHSEKALRIYDIDGETDVTPELDLRHGDHVVVLIPDLRRLSILSAWQLNALSHKSAQEKAGMFATLYGNGDEITEWEDLYMPDYPVYVAEDTPMKEAARGNPAVIFLRNGNILWKTSLRHLSASGLLDEDSKTRLPAWNPESDFYLEAASVVYVGLLALLIVFSFVPVGIGLGRKFFHKGRSAGSAATRDDKEVL